MSNRLLKVGKTYKLSLLHIILQYLKAIKIVDNVSNFYISLKIDSTIIYVILADRRPTSGHFDLPAAILTYQQPI